MKRKRRRLDHARIRALREELGLTQVQLAQKIDSDKGSVSHWERGDYSPGGRCLPRLADALGVSIDDLFCGAT